MTPEAPAEPLLLRSVELLSGRHCDVRISDGRIAAIGDLTAHPGEHVIDGLDAALSVGLTDHHVHLLAMAAARTSLDLSPTAAPARADVVTALAAARPDANGWIRAVGYAEQAGEFDAAFLDAVQPSVPVRVQHRSGALWVLNSAALRAAGFAGEPIGRLFRRDSELAARLPAAPPPDLVPVGRELAGYGITAVTDATPDLPRESQTAIEAATESRALPQFVTLLGAETSTAERVSIGPHKIVLADSDLPSFDEVCTQIAVGRSAGRAVAVHCVTYEALALLIAALDAVGPQPGDRIEHASLVPSDALAELRRLGVTVVTQPGFLADRGDDYRRDVPAEELGDLYRVRTLAAAGVPVVCSSDAPYGPADPWRVLAAAAERRTESGAVLNLAERVSVRTALDGYLADAARPAGPPRAVTVGTPGDLVLLHVPWSAALAQPSRDLVRCTLIGGRIFDI